MQYVVARHMDTATTRKQEQWKNYIFQRNYVLINCSINDMEKTLPRDTYNKVDTKTNKKTCNNHLLILRGLTVAHNYIRQQSTQSKIRILTTFRYNRQTYNKEPLMRNI